MNSNLNIIILAAGYGTRMNSSMPKVMHRVASQTMIRTIVNVALELNPEQIVVVIGKEMSDVKNELAQISNAKISFAYQDQRLGTADAVKIGLRQIKSDDGNFLVLYGDSPLIEAGTITKLLETHSSAALTLASFYKENNDSYGIIIANHDEVSRIVEYKEATVEEREIAICNSGVMIINISLARKYIDRINNNNSKAEYYLTDIVGLLSSNRYLIRHLTVDGESVMGVNSKLELAEAEKIMQQRLRRRAMINGVTMIDPQTVYLATDTEFGCDIVIHPHVVIGQGCVISDGSIILPFSHLESANIGKNNIIGPFARLRPNTSTGVNVKIGNFVEIKNSQISDDSKMSHLSYIGDASIGANVNIGAGVITVNYDGFRKHRTNIADGAFIGSNSTIIAPSIVGSNAIIAAASVITRDVEEDAIAISRNVQKNLDGAASRFRRKKLQEGLTVE